LADAELLGRRNSTAKPIKIGHSSTINSTTRGLPAPLARLTHLSYAVGVAKGPKLQKQKKSFEDFLVDLQLQAESEVPYKPRIPFLTYSLDPV
jgi:hypothetical protein